MAKFLARKAVIKENKIRLSLPSLGVTEQSSGRKVKTQSACIEAPVQKASCLDTLKLPRLNEQQHAHSDPVRRRKKVVSIQFEYIEEPISISSLTVELYEVAMKWKKFAIKFGISREEIIKTEEENLLFPDRCLIIVLTHWFDNNPNLSWQDIIDILKSTEISEPGIATRIKKQYC